MERQASQVWLCTIASDKELSWYSERYECVVRTFCHSVDGKFEKVQNTMIKMVTLLIIIFGVVQACSSESLKRTAYETMENVKQQECHKDLSTECPERQRYEDYQRDKEELERSEQHSP